MSTPLIKEFTYNVPVEEVWQALTDKDKMKEWYFPQLQKFEPEVGFKFQFEDGSDRYRKEWAVTNVVDCKTLAHNWAYEGYNGNSEVIFDLCRRGQNQVKDNSNEFGKFSKSSAF